MDSVSTLHVPSWGCRRMEKASRHTIRSGSPVLNCSGDSDGTPSATEVVEMGDPVGQGWSTLGPRVKYLRPSVTRITYLLTYSMMQSPSWEANWFAASQEIPRILRNPKVHYRTHKRPLPVSILGQPNPVHIPTSHLLEIHPNIIHPSTVTIIVSKI